MIQGSQFKEAQHPNKEEPSQRAEDEINLIEISLIIFRHWKWLFGVTLVFVSGVVSYAYLSPPSYRVDAILLPPPAPQIMVGFNQLLCDMPVDNNRVEANVSPISNYQKLPGGGELLLCALTADNIFKQTVLNLNSFAVQDEFIKNNPSFFGKFDISLRVENNPAEGVIVALEGNERGKLTEDMNEYLSYISDITATQLIEGTKARFVAKINELEDVIDILRIRAKMDRQDRVIVLREALEIARRIGITDMVINPADAPLYLRGITALTAEIEVLENWDEDKWPIKGLHDFQNDINRLSSLNVGSISIQPFQIGRTVKVPSEPFRPNRLLIIFLGIFAGLLSGIISCFAVNAIKTMTFHREAEF
ncbi:MAG: hypothetical protein KKG47_12980 [Proteobacteria bacterium]|nr:hypothetical protein [Pseudomonadota bacterium]MBU1738766.1 hypothetical protein [Pseudomonadota bacterium]